jgi:hypothetical protein
MPSHFFLTLATFFVLPFVLLLPRSLAISALCYKEIFWYGNLKIINPVNNNGRAFKFTLNFTHF